VDIQALLAIGIFIIAHGFIISEKIHRIIIAMVGGGCIVRIVDQKTAVKHIDFNTLGLLIGMMIIVSITAESGVF
jgi:Na+/H+ antiporter NhaD/arsenite permease-like protein